MYDLSRRPDITESIPVPLSAQGERARAYSSDKRFDIVVNGMGFLLWADPSHPYRRGAEQVQKEQFDNSREAGEQTLGGPWIRSQTSWHQGAGIEFYEPGAEVDTQYRFNRSHGVDVWTEGQASLLPAMTQAVAAMTGTVRVAHYRHAGADGYVLGHATSMRRYNAAGVLQATSAALAGVTLGPVTGIAGRTYHSTASAITYLNWSGGGVPTSTAVRTTAAAPTAMAVVKHRLLVATGRSLYWVADTGAGGVLGEGDDLLIHTHPDASWTWTGISETSDAILLTGNDGVSSRVYALVVGNDAEVPEFESPVEVLQLPPGEIVNDLQTYLGTYIVAATTSGVRVGVLGGEGQVQIGPLSVDRAGTSVAFWDRFAYVGVTGKLEDGTSGVIRIDLSAPIGETELYPWACDVSVNGAFAVTSTEVLPDGTVLIGAGTGLFRPSGSLLTEGWFETGKIRFATTEKKDFQRVVLVGTLNTGSVDIDAIVGATT